MMRSLQIAATGMAAQETNVEVIANNVANVNTTAFKRRQAEFQDLLYQNISGVVGVQTNVGGNIAPVGTAVGLGVKTAGIAMNTEQGALTQTDASLNVAILGEGYFTVTDSNGTEYYTRNGNFSRDADGQIVNSQGYIVSPGITIPDDASEININSDGEVIAIIDGQTDGSNLGRIDLTVFPNANGLRAEGNSLFTETEASGTPIASSPGEIGYGSLEQGFLEASNVDAVFEITNLITAQRAYELNSRVISTADEISNAINQV